MSSQDILNQAVDEYNKKMVDAGKVRINKDGDYILCPPSEWKDGEDKDKALAEIEEIMKLRKKEAEQKAIELLISKGMMIKNADGEYEFKNFDYKPTRIGVITPGNQ